MEFDIFEDTKKYNYVIIDEEGEEIENKVIDIIPPDFSKNTHTVIDMNKQPLKIDNSWMVKDLQIDPEPSEAEKKLLEGTKNPQQLLEEEANETEPELTEEQIFEEFKKDYITKVKVLALYKCKFYPLDNPSNFSNVDKQRVIDKMGKILKNYTYDELTDEFNTLMNGILTDPKTKYENLPLQRK